MRVNQPSNQIKLTNVSIVRLKKGGKRFEIACYKNKVQEWRTGVEKDIDEVLQISNVFMNVSKGEVAKAEDLKKAFGKSDTNTVVMEILNKGEVQVGEKERAHEQTNLWNQLATLVSEKTVEPSSQMPYSVGIIEKAMTEAGYSLKPDKSAKSQVSACIKQIQEHTKLPIQRARMRLRVTLKLAVSDDESLKKEVVDGVDEVENEQTTEDGWQVTMLADPSHFGRLTDLLKNKGRLETLNSPQPRTTEVL